MKLNRLLRSPVATGALFVLAAALLLGGSIGVTRAALNIFSDDYVAQVEMRRIGVSLYENGQAVSTAAQSADYASLGRNVSTGTLLTGILGDDDYVKPGKNYDAAFSVYNSGEIPEYVRVTVYKYWMDADGSKRTDLDPGLIDLHLNGAASGDWIADPIPSSERRVYYYRSILPSGGVTSELTDTLTIDGDIAVRGHESTSSFTRDGTTYTVITTTYDYDDVFFQVEIVVDAVQTHHAENAILSAWGRTVTLDGSGNILSIKEAS